MRNVIRKLRWGMFAGMVISGPALAQDIQAPSLRPRTTDRERPSDAGTTVKEDLKEAMLNAKVRLALLKGMTGADGLRVNVTVRRDVVYLGGEVRDRASEKLASEMALSVKGVSDVKSNIRLNPDTEQQDDFDALVNDGVLASEVRMGLLKEVGNDALDIHVETANGVVSLRGNVPNAASRYRAVEKVKEIPDVKRVEDLITITKR